MLRTRLIPWRSDNEFYIPNFAEIFVGTDLQDGEVIAYDINGHVVPAVGSIPCYQTGFCTKTLRTLKPHPEGVYGFYKHLPKDQWLDVVVDHNKDLIFKDGCAWSLRDSLHPRARL